MGFGGRFLVRHPALACYTVPVFETFIFYFPAQDDHMVWPSRVKLRRGGGSHMTYFLRGKSSPGGWRACDTSSSATPRGVGVLRSRSHVPRRLVQGNSGRGLATVAGPENMFGRQSPMENPRSGIGMTHAQLFKICSRACGSDACLGIELGSWRAVV